MLQIIQKESKTDSETKSKLFNSKYAYNFLNNHFAYLYRIQDLHLY